MKFYVFSNTLSQKDCPGVVVSSVPAKVVAELKATKGKDIWLFGGGSLFSSMLELGLVDSVELAIIKVLLGSGIPLLPGLTTRKSLQLARHRIYERTGTVFLEYVPA